MKKMSHIKTGLLVFICTVGLSFNAFGEGTANGAKIGTTGEEADNKAEVIKKKIKCSFEEASGTKSGEQGERQEYMSEHLAKVFSQLYPEIEQKEMQHIVAQGMAETDAARLVKEEQSKYASSRSEFKGRGLCQTTHKDNYAKLAGCEKVIKKYPFPSQIPLAEFSKPQKDTGSDIVSDPEKVSREDDERSKMLAAIGCICYFMEQRERHPSLKDYLKRDDDKAVREVGVTLNKGPGKLDTGAKPLGEEKRKKMFDKAGRCFDGPAT